MYSDALALGHMADADDRMKALSSAREHFKCQNCFAGFLRGLFVVFGSVTDPSKQYHLELSFQTDKERDAACDLIQKHGIEMKRGKRKSRYIMYIKDSGRIEDFFAAVGANSAAFDLINAKIVREVRENANRQSNCDMANIKKSLGASKKYIDIIQKMTADGSVLRLSPELRETAELRINNTQATMTELALMHRIPISKSGVKHRLDKICEIAAASENGGKD